MSLSLGNQKIVPRFVRQGTETIDLPVCANLAHICEYADRTIREITLKLLDNGNAWVVLVAHGEKNLISQVILAAETGEIVVGLRGLTHEQASIC